MNNDDLRNVILKIKNYCKDYDEILLVYNMGINQLEIIDEFEKGYIFNKFSLSNFHKLLSLLKNDYETRYFTYEKIKKIEVNI